MRSDNQWTILQLLKPAVPTQIRLKRTVLTFGVLIGLPCFAGVGCAQSAQSSYSRHLRAVIQPSADRDPEILAAFGIDSNPTPGTDTMLVAWLPDQP